MRFILSTDKETKYFKTYKSAFNEYMKVRDDSKWLYIYDNEKFEYLVCENCNCKA